MIRRWLLLFGLLTVSMLAAKTPLHTVVVVTDSLGHPIPQVVITNGQRLWQTDAKGQVSLPGSREPRTYRVSRVGWKSCEIAVADITLHVVLEISPHVLPTISVTAEHSSALGDIAGKHDVPVPLASTPSSVLQQVPSLLETPTTLSGKAATVSILGHLPRHTLVMIDGVPMNANGEAFDLNSIPAGLIDRIEVLPVGSGTGGSGEIGGVVNLITRQPETRNDPSLTATVSSSTGSFGKHDDSVRLEGGLPWVFGSLTFSGVNADNDFSFEYPQSSTPYQKRHNNDYRERTLHTVLDFPQQHLASWYTYQHFEKGLPGPINQQAMYDHCRLEGWRSQGDLKYSHSGRDLNWFIEGFAKVEHSILDNRHSTNTYNAFHRYTSSNRFQLDAGFDAKLWEIENHVEVGDRMDTYCDSQPADILAALSDFYVTEDYYAALRSRRQIPLGNSWRIDLAAAGRTENVRYTKLFADRTLSRNSGSTDLTLNHLGNWSSAATVTYASTFSLPSFYDLCWQGDTQAVGNPDLKPEQSHTLRIALENGYAGQTLSLGWRRDWVDDLIYWHKGVLGWKPDNIASARITNWDMQLQLKPVSTVEGTFAWTRTLAYDQTTGYSGKELTYTPSSLVKAGVAWEQGPLRWHTDYQRVGERWVTRDHLRPALPPYETVNGGLSAKFTVSDWLWQISLDGFNLLNRHYQEYDAEPQPGTSCEVKLSVQYKL